jgi:UDP-2,3-diacylglucosamine hydrolase
MALYFISDLHLEAQRADISGAFFDYLDQLPQDAEHLYILGDFFEVWVGDDDDDAFHNQVIDALAAKTAAGTHISLMHGNRDFLLGTRFAARSGVTLLPDPFLLDYGNRQYLLMHGDSLCTADARYMAFRTQVRDPAWQAALLQKPLQERRTIARSLRETSQKEGAQKAEYITDVTPQDVVHALQSAGVRTLIHGHTHRPAIHDVDIGSTSGKRIVLGDWDKAGFDLRIDNSSIQLRRFALANVQEKTVYAVTAAGAWTPE